MRTNSSQEKIKPKLNPEKGLWAAVLLRTFTDLDRSVTDSDGSSVGGAEIHANRLAAIEHAVDPRKYVGSLSWICEMLEYDEDIVRNTLKSKFSEEEVREIPRILEKMKASTPESQMKNRYRKLKDLLIREAVPGKKFWGACLDCNPEIAESYVLDGSLRNIRGGLFFDDDIDKLNAVGFPVKWYMSGYGDEKEQFELLVECVRRMKDKALSIKLVHRFVGSGELLDKANLKSRIDVMLEAYEVDCSLEKFIQMFGISGQESNVYASKIMNCKIIEDDYIILKSYGFPSFWIDRASSKPRLLEAASKFKSSPVVKAGPVAVKCVPKLGDATALTRLEHLSSEFGMSGHELMMHIGLLDIEAKRALEDIRKGFVLEANSKRKLSNVGFPIKYIRKGSDDVRLQEFRSRMGITVKPEERNMKEVEAKELVARIDELEKTLLRAVGSDTSELEYKIKDLSKKIEGLTIKNGELVKENLRLTKHIEKIKSLIGGEE